MPPKVKQLARSRWLLPFVYGALVSIAMADAFTQQGFAHGVLYLPLVILSAFHAKPPHVISITLLAIALT